MAFLYDAFLSHNSRDKGHVRQIADYLGKQGLRIYLDERELVPGDQLDVVFRDALIGSRVVLLFIGPNNVGPFQSREIQAAFFRQAGEKQMRPVPVFLPGTTAAQRGDFIANVGEILFLGFSGHSIYEPRVLDAMVQVAKGQETPPPAVAAPVPVAAPVAAAPLAPAAAAPGVLAADPAGGPAAETEAVVEQLTRQLANKGLLVVLGWTWAHRGADGLPDPGSTAAHILRRLPRQPASKEHIPDTLDQAAFALFVKSSLDFPDVERAALGDYVGPRTIEVDAVYHELALLLRALIERNARRGPAETQEPHVVLTTAPDLRLERAMMLAGMPFTRAVVSWREASPEIQWRCYDTFALDARGMVVTTTAEGQPLVELTYDEVMGGVPAGDPAADADRAARQAALHAELQRVHERIREAGASGRLPPLAELVRYRQHADFLRLAGRRPPPGAIDSGLRLPRPILVKLHGSLDVADSWCALPEQVSSFHKLQLPDVLKSATFENASLTLGFSPSEPQFLQLHAALLAEPFCAKRRGPKRVMVAPRPQDDFDPQAALDRSLHDLMRGKADRLFGVEISENSPHEFVAALRRRVESAARTAWT